MKLKIPKAKPRVLRHWLLRSLVVGSLSAFLPGSAAHSAQTEAMSSSASIGGYQAKFVDVNGARTRYYDAGSDVILPVHGARPSGTSSANTWVPIFSGLSKRFRVLGPDRLGHGMTENPKGDYSVTAEMEHLYGFIKAMGIDKFYIMG
jgi:hypothetical protein